MTKHETFRWHSILMIIGISTVLCSSGCIDIDGSYASKLKEREIEKEELKEEIKFETGKLERRDELQMKLNKVKSRIFQFENFLLERSTK